MKRLLLALILCMIPAIYADDTTDKAPNESAKTEELDPIIRLRNAYNKNRQGLPRQKASGDSDTSEAEEKEPSKFYPLAKHFVREAVIAYGVQYGYAKIMGNPIDQKRMIFWSLFAATGINIPGILEFGLRHII